MREMRGALESEHFWVFSDSVYGFTRMYFTVRTTVDRRLPLEPLQRSLGAAENVIRVRASACDRWCKLYLYNPNPPPRNRKPNLQAPSIAYGFMPWYRAGLEGP